MIEEITDQNLWDAIRKSDEDALNKLFDRYYFELVRSGIIFCQEPDTARDAANEVFCNLWKNRERLSEVSNAKAYLSTVYRNQLINWFRKNKNYRDRLNIWKEGIEVNQSSYEEVLVNSQIEEEKKEKVRQAIQLLSPKQKEYLEYKYFLGLSYEEIIAKTGVSMKTLYNTIHEAVKTLREKLGEEKKS